MSRTFHIILGGICSLILLLVLVATTHPEFFSTTPLPYRSTFFADLDDCRQRAGFHPEQRDLYREELQSFERQARYNKCMDGYNHPNQWLY